MIARCNLFERFTGREHAHLALRERDLDAGGIQEDERVQGGDGQPAIGQRDDLAIRARARWPMTELAPPTAGLQS